MTTEKKLTKAEAREELWRRGILLWKCHAVQKEMYEIFYKSPSYSILVWLLSRQSGKSYLLAILALECAIRKDSAIVKIVTDTKLHIKSIMKPIFDEILRDCPKDIMPEYKENKFIYYFPNGSQIQLAGTDNKHYNKLRGQKADLVLVDEGAFCRELDNVITSVLLPTTTHTGGKLVIASSAPEEPDHDFVRYIEDAEMKGQLTSKDIDQNPMLTKEQVEKIAEMMGGRNSEKFRREYKNEIIKNSSVAVIPEFTPLLEKEIIKDWPKPPFLDNYVAMDIGGMDLTVVLYGYYDFRADKVIIEDEIVFDFTDEAQTLPKFVELMSNKEKSLWSNVLTNEMKKPLIRVSDINYIAIGEIRRLSNQVITFDTAKKDDNNSAINNLREMLQAKKIIISPRCTTLIRHLRNVRWMSSVNKTKFARSPDNGHYDAVDAIKYFIRHVQYNRNPYPSHYGMNMKDLYVHNKEGFYGNANINDALKKVFNIRKKRYG